MPSLRHHPRRTGETGRSEVGETLIEVLATVLLLGTGIVAIIGALLTSVTVARQNQEQTIAALAAQKGAEEMAAGFSSSQTSATAIVGALNYVGCGANTAYGSGGNGNIALPSDPVGDATAQNYSHYTAKVTKVEYLRGDSLYPTGYDGNGTPQWRDYQQYGVNCDLNPQKDKAVSGMQRITIEVQKDGRLVDSVVVYKRNEVCPDGFSNADQGPC